MTDEKERVPIFRPPSFAPTSEVASDVPQADYYTKKPHPYRPGYLITFSDGSKFSLIDLSKIQYSEEKLPEELRKQAIEFNRMSAEGMDVLGGVFEAISLDDNLDVTFRGNSYEEVIEQLIEYHFALNRPSK